MSAATPRLARDVVQGLAAICRATYDQEIPTFLRGAHRDVSPKDVISFKNGLLVASQVGGELTMLDHTPSWFSTVSLPYDFDPNATCPKWLAFLVDVIGDADAIELLAQWFGLMLTSDTSYQKILLFVGPKRSGKGTILRLLQRVIGPDACVSPSLGSLASEFGLWPLVGKSVALFPDAHLGRGADDTRVLEVLKSISGEDSVSINRKNLGYLANVSLGVRFVLTANELPRFNDPSDALGSRLLLLSFPNSFADRVDRTLEAKLVPEVPGILNWALRGLRRLRAADGFKEPEKSGEILKNYKRLTSPISAFVEDYCKVSPGESEPTAVLYSAWKTWCEDNGHKPGSTATFGGHLRAAEPSIERRRPSADDGGRVYSYCGICLVQHPS